MASVERPWWQTTRTPKWGYILGAFWLLLALLRPLVGVAPGRSVAWTVALTVLPAALGVVYLVTAELLRRRQRSTEDGSGARTD